MTKSMKITTACTLLFFLGSCATITRGTQESVHFTSTPDSARVELSNGYSCSSTPCSITVPRKINATVTFTKEGCEVKSTNIQSTASSDGAWMIAGNLIFGGIIGLIVDAITGAANDVTPNPVNVKLNC